MLCVVPRNASAPAPPVPARWAIALRTSPRSPPTPTAAAHRVIPSGRNSRRRRHTGRTAPTPTPPRHGAPRNRHPPPHTATTTVCHRVWAYPLAPRPTPGPRQREDVDHVAHQIVGSLVPPSSAARGRVCRRIPVMDNRFDPWAFLLGNLLIAFCVWLILSAFVGSSRRLSVRHSIGCGGSVDVLRPRPDRRRRRGHRSAKDTSYPCWIRRTALPSVRCAQ